VTAAPGPRQGAPARGTRASGSGQRVGPPQQTGEEAAQVDQRHYRTVYVGRHSKWEPDEPGLRPDPEPDFTPEERGRLLGEIQAAARARKFTLMESLLRRLLAVDEHCAEAWYGLGMLLLQDGSLEEAYDSLSEYAMLAGVREAAEKVELALFFLERLAGGGDELPYEIQDELEEGFLAAFSEPGWSDVPRAALKGLTPREAVRDREGKRQVLKLMRDKGWFLDAAVQAVEGVG